jgi:hypothetical protein
MRLPTLTAVFALPLCLVLLAPIPSAQGPAEVQLFDSNGEDFDQFGGGTSMLFIADGSGVALDGDVLAVGSADDTVTISRFNGSAWVEEAELSRAGDPLGQGFGTALALDGDLLAVGSFAADVGAQIDQGTVTLYGYDGSAWVQGQTLTHPTGDAGDMFGASLALDDDVLVVGAPYDDEGALFAVGTAVVHRHNGAAWVVEQTLTMSGGTHQDSFGFSVAVHDDVIAVGAALDDVGADFDRGSARVFRYDGLGWNEEDVLVTPDGAAGDFYGWSVEVHGSRLFVSEPFADLGLGGVRVYGFDGIGWVQEQVLQASAGSQGELFGAALDLDGDQLAVGAPYRTYGFEFQQGAAVVFEHDGAQFQEVHDQTSSDGELGDIFGTSVGLSDGRLASAAPGDDTQLDGDIGSVWVVTVVEPWSDEGCALAGVAGAPLLVGSGSLAEGSTNQVTLSQAAAGALSGVFLGLASNPTPFKGGTLKPVPLLVEPILLPTDGSGGWALPFVMPAAIPSGTELWVQVGIQDGAAVAGVSLSNAVRGLTP